MWKRSSSHIPFVESSDAISFCRIGRDGKTAEMRRSGRAWKKLVADFGESVHQRPAVAMAVAGGTQPKLYVGPVHSHHDDRWSRERCMVSKDEC